MARQIDEAALRAQLKMEIRSRRRATRRALPADARDRRSAEICQRVLELPEWAEAKTVLAFVSMRREVQTGNIVRAAWAQGKRVATTRMTASRDDLELREWEEDTELEESGMMFLQPGERAAPIEEASVDLVLVPALAVDERGHRIGYGKGFYDRLLPRLTRALRVALVFDFERIVEVPNHSGDVPVHLLITDQHTLRLPRD